MKDNKLQELVNENADYLYTEYKFAGHDVWDSAYRDTTVLKWLLSKRKRITDLTSHSYTTVQNVTNELSLQEIQTPSNIDIQSDSVRLKYSNNMGYSWQDVKIDSILNGYIYIDTKLVDCPMGRFKIESYNSSGVIATDYSSYYNINNQSNGVPFLTFKTSIDLIEIDNDTIPVNFLAVDSKNEPLQLNVYYEKNNSAPDSLIQTIAINSNNSYQLMNIILNSVPTGTNVQLKFSLSDNNYTVYDSTRRFILTHNANCITKNTIWADSTREYTLYVPTKYDKNKSRPLVFILPGFQEHASDDIRDFQFNTLAERDTVILVYPQALKGTTSWGLGPFVMWNADWGMNIDDIGYLNYLIDRIYTDYNIDVSRVYATGLSNGAYMSYMMATSLPNRIAPIAAVEGDMNFQMEDYMPTDIELSVLHIHTLLDSEVLYGGVSGWSPSIPEDMNFWAGKDNCDSGIVSIELPNIDTTDHSTVTMLNYSGCKKNTEVILYRIEGGLDNSSAHWPQGLFDPFANKDINATSLIWDFFMRHNLSNPQQGTNLSVPEININSSLHIYPNPGNGIFYFSDNTEIFEQVSVYDISGKVLMKKNNFHSSNSIDISDQSQGIYIVKIINNQGIVESFKLIKI